MVSIQLQRMARVSGSRDVCAPGKLPGHPVSLDLLPWLQLRSNLVQNWHKYDHMESTSYLSCCLKVRYPWGKAILERDERDDLQISQDFLDAFTEESGWG